MIPAVLLLIAAAAILVLSKRANMASRSAQMSSCCPKCGGPTNFESSTCSHCSFVPNEAVVQLLRTRAHKEDMIRRHQHCWLFAFALAECAVAVLFWVTASAFLDSFSQKPKTCTLTAPEVGILSALGFLSAASVLSLGVINMIKCAMFAISQCHYESTFFRYFRCGFAKTELSIGLSLASLRTLIIILRWLTIIGASVFFFMCMMLFL